MVFCKARPMGFDDYYIVTSDGKTSERVHGSSIWMDGQMTRSAQICNGEERSERESEADNLPVDLRSNPHLWSRALGTGRKNEVADSSSGNGMEMEISFIWQLGFLLVTGLWRDYISRLTWERLGVPHTSDEVDVMTGPLCLDCCLRTGIVQNNWI